MNDAKFLETFLFMITLSLTQSYTVCINAIHLINKNVNFLMYWMRDG